MLEKKGYEVNSGISRYILRREPGCFDAILGICYKFAVQTRITDQYISNDASEFYVSTKSYFSLKSEDEFANDLFLKAAKELPSCAKLNE